MESEPSAIRPRLEESTPNNDGRPSAVVIDLADNPYHIIRDPFLGHLATTARSWLRSRPKQTLIILLPGAGLPSPASLFWAALNEAGEDALDRLIVVGDDGTVWPAERQAALSQPEYTQGLGRSRISLLDQLRERVIRRPGHYQFGSDPHVQCARYYFETYRADREIGELVADWARRTVYPSLDSGERLTIVSHGQSESFHDAIAGAASTAGCGFGKLQDDGTLTEPIQSGDVVAPVLNVVNSGLTFRTIVTNLRDGGIRVASEALAIITTSSSYSQGVQGVRLAHLCGPYRREKLARDMCEQCKLRLPVTQPGVEAQLGIRAYDMWGILLDSDWEKEAFGAPRRRLYRSIPNLRSAFHQEYGNYIAYKVLNLLRTVGLQGDLVLVCPNEIIVEELILRLSILLGYEQIAVRIPRSVIRDYDSQRRLAQHEDQDWHIQLSNLGRQQFQNVVLLDEFAGSKATARVMSKILQAFGLDPVVYVPIIDFSPDIALPGIPTYPLYRIPNPRSLR